MVHEILCHVCSELGHTSKLCPGVDTIRQLKQAMRDKITKSAKANVARAHKTNQLTIAAHRAKVKKQAREAKAVAMSAAAAEESESDSDCSNNALTRVRDDYAQS